MSERRHFVKTQTLAIKLPADLFETLDAICNRLGMQKNFIIEAAIREKIEDLLDGEDLREAVKEATGFHSWQDVKAKTSKEGLE
jgi:predicted DNA-binding protein